MASRRSSEATRSPARIGASYRSKSQNRKLSPILEIRVPGKKRPKFVPEGPFIDTTNVSIAATCSDGCPFKGNGCYAQSGFTRFQANKRDGQARGHRAREVIAEEGRLIDESHGGGRVPQDGARGGRDLRLHDSGDAGSVAGARMLARAALRWRRRGGGPVFTYTHWWRTIPREAWGSDINVLASVEDAEDIDRAMTAGYAAAIVVAKFPAGRKGFRLPGSTAKIIPCPHESGAGSKESSEGRVRPITCVECRLCIDHDLLGRKVAIAFEAHGPGASKTRDALVQLRRGPKVHAGCDRGDKSRERTDVEASEARDLTTARRR